MSDYYQINAQSYYEKTASVDPASFLSPLLKFLPEKAEILDIGCGSGRDMKWLKQRGFRPKGLEQSSSLAALAEEFSKCPVFTADFEHFDFSSLEMDAIVMIGAAVHVPHSRLKEILCGILQALKSGGVLMISQKEGHGQRNDKTGRTFYLWQDDFLRDIFKSLGLSVLSFSRQSSVLDTGEVWLGYILRYGSEKMPGN